MDVVVGISLGLIVFLVGLTFFFFQKQRKLKKNLIHKSKKTPKYEILETSDDSLYYEYYEPKIIKIVPMEESAK